MPHDCDNNQQLDQSKRSAFAFFICEFIILILKKENRKTEKAKTSKNNWIRNQNVENHDHHNTSNYYNSEISRDPVPNIPWCTHI